ncbi:MAG: hypothetical protein HZB16_00995 [Armatimonadetes bacterium]|nr:hypothetical protein [Armatimonadota bacterium]
MAFASPPVPVNLDQAEPSPHLARAWALRVITLLLLGGLFGRLWVLQIVRGGEAERLAARNRVRLEPTVAPRGAIFDGRGQLLATNRLSHRIALVDLSGAREDRRARTTWMINAASPRAAASVDMPMPTVDEQLALLARLLRLTPDDVGLIRTELASRTRPRFAPVTVIDDADAKALTLVQERLWQLPSVVIDPVPARRYPAGRLAAHVVGYVGSISPKELDARRAEEQAAIDALRLRIDNARNDLPNSQLSQLAALNRQLQVAERLRNQTARTVGKTGLEAAHDTELQGEPGIQTWQVNARGLPIKLLSTSQGEAGNALWLNLDLRLQKVAAEALVGRRGSAVAIDPRDGAVLAMVSSPGYDPNDFVPKINSALWQSILDDTAHPMENRALRSAYPPGSTFKGIVSTAAGFKAGVISEHTSCSCGGALRIGGHLKKCWMTHGGVDLQTAIAQSCDVFFYIAGLRMGPTPIIDMAKGFGLGEPTGIDLPEERGGNLPDPEQHKRRWRREWYPGDTANLVIGQGDVNCTALHEVRSRDGQTVVKPWQPVRRGTVPASADALRQIKQGMVLAVTHGTAAPAALPGINVAGKTGSAEVGGDREAHAWFCCFAPVERPRVAVAVMVENGGHGSEAAAPIARAMMSTLFELEGKAP